MSRSESLQSFTWEGSGLKLNVPADAVKETIEILIYISLSGQFQFPKNCELVSAVYCIQVVEGKLAGPINIEMQHCAVSITNLAFVYAPHSLSGAPMYRFVTVNPSSSSHFSPTCGSITHSQFDNKPSLIAIVKHKPRIRALLSSDSQCRYRASVYFSAESLTEWSVYFTVVRDQDPWLQVCIIVSGSELIVYIVLSCLLHYIHASVAKKRMLCWWLHLIPNDQVSNHCIQMSHIC